MNREAALERLARETFDVLIVGGGATGLGAAVDAATRGYRTALVEGGDFACGTSSRSTKLVHGGVRYLQQGNVALVREALHERAALHRNAPHLVTDREFVVPAYDWISLAYYRAGLLAYDALAGRSAFGRSRRLTPGEARERLPFLRADGLRGAIAYHDGEFDDARLAITLARTAVDAGAAIANYARVSAFVRQGGRVAGAVVTDRESGSVFNVRAAAVVNATGIFADEVRAIDDANAAPLLRFSRGSHIVVQASRAGLPRSALLVPKTRDRRVLFVVPWNGRIVVGTTDVAQERAAHDPHPSPEEIAYILETAAPYMETPLREDDITAAFAGIRPLVARTPAGTARLSREHAIEVSASGLITITGGKWTTYRKMAQDALDTAIDAAGLPKAACTTQSLPLRGATASAADEPFGVYGTDARDLLALVDADPALGERLHPRLPYVAAQVIYARTHEMARNADDVLARRLRATFLDEAAARECRPRVEELLAR